MFNLLKVRMGFSGNGQFMELNQASRLWFTFHKKYFIFKQFFSLQKFTQKYAFIYIQFNLILFFTISISYLYNILRLLTIFSISCLYLILKFFL